MNPLPPHDLRPVMPDGAGGVMPPAPGVGQLAGGVTPPPPIVNAPPNGMALLKALKRRWQVAVVAGSVVAVAVAAGLFTFVPTGQHTAKVVLELHPRAPVHIGIRVNEEIPRLENFRETQKVLIKNQKVISKAVADPKVAQLPTIKAHGDPTMWLEKGLTFNVPGDAQILEVKLEGERVEDIRIILNAIIKNYIADFIASDDVIRAARLEALKKLEADLNQVIKANDQYRNKQLDKGGAITAAFVNGDISRQRERISKLDEEIQGLELQVAQHERHDPRTGPLDQRYLREWLAQDQVLKDLQNALVQAKAEVADAVRVGAVARIVEGYRETQRTIEKQLVERQQEVSKEAEKTLRPIAIQNFLAEDTKLKETLEGKRLLLDRLKKDLARNEKTYEQALRSAARVTDDSLFKYDATADMLRQVTAEKLRLEAESHSGPRVREIEEARVIPVDPRERKFKMALLGGVASFLLVLAGLALWEFQGRRVDSTDQIVYGLGIPLVGTVPAMPPHRLLGLAGGASSEEWRFAVQQAVATARTVLLNAARSTNMRMVMVTSATAGEGKTSLSTQLAVSLAMAGHRTLLLDFDLRNPSAHKLLGMPKSPGWAEILRGELNVAEAIRPTSLEKLSFIPAGECDPIALMSMVQDELGQVLNWLRSQFDFVVVDTCPVLPVVDALLLGRHMDGVIFSVLNEVSQIPKVYVATQRITQLGIRLLGAVVNGVKEDKYGYGSQGVRRPRAPGAGAIQTPFPANGYQTPRPSGPAMQ